MWRGIIRGHSAFWLNDVIFDCYTKEKGFDSYKAWNIINTHRIKKEKVPVQKSIWK